MRQAPSGQSEVLDFNVFQGDVQPEVLVRAQHAAARGEYPVEEQMFVRRPQRRVPDDIATFSPSLRICAAFSISD